MTIKEFWDLQEKTEDLTQIYDTFIAFYDQEFSEETLKKYELFVPLTDMIHQLESQKKFPQIDNLKAVIQKNPEMYAETFLPFSTTLLAYYCYEGILDKEEAQTYLEEFFQVDFDELIVATDRLIYFGYQDVVLSFLDNNIELLKAEKFDKEFAFLLQFLYERGRLYSQYEDFAEVNWQPLKTSLQRYDADFDKENVLGEEFEGLLISEEPIKNIIPDLDWVSILMSWEKGFVSMMRKKGCGSFQAISIYQFLFFYLREEKQAWDSDNKTLIINASSIKKYIAQRKGLRSGYYIEESLFLWGFDYLLEFLKQEEIGTEEHLSAQQEVIRTLKQDFIQKYPFNLWECSFIHKWKSVNPQQADNHEDERLLFRHSYLKTGKLQARFDEKSAMANLKDMLNLQGVTAESLNLPPKRVKSAPAPKKIGRNDKVSVRYRDGKTKENVKFKKIEADFENGLCQLI